MDYVLKNLPNVKSEEDFWNIITFIHTCTFMHKRYNYHALSYGKYIQLKCKPASEQYRVFSIKKKSGKKRVIHAPNGILLEVQQCLNQILQMYYKPIKCVSGFVPKRSIIYGAEQHTGKKYVYNIDLKDFFDYIDIRRVKKALKELFAWNNDDFFMPHYFAKLCCCDKIVTRTNVNGRKNYIRACVLPQGAPTSPMLTNIVCQDMDKQLQELATNHFATFTRYADDITFSCDTNIFNPNSEFCIALRRIVQRDNRFVINKQKTRIQSNIHQQEVTGIIVNKKVNIKKHYVKQLRMWLYLWEHYGYDRAQNFFISDYLKDKGHVKKPCSKIENVLCGKLDYLKMVVRADSEMYKKLHSRYMALIAPPKTSENGSITRRAEFPYLKKACVQLEIPFNEQIII